MKEDDLKVVDFFCGAGGMSQGMKMSGMKVLVGIDKDKDCKDTEPPRICRRLHFLRGWSNEQTQTLSPGSPGTSRAAGAGAPGEL